MSGSESAGKFSLVKMAPALSGFFREQGSEAALQELAERLVPSSVEAGTALDSLPPAVRFVVSGKVEVKRQGRLLPHNVQPLGVGSVLGLEAVAGFLDANAPAVAIPRAITAEPTLFLELRAEDFGRVSRPLLEWLRRVHQAWLMAEDIVLSLGEEPRFANVPGLFLFRLVESAARVDGESRTLLQRGRVPGDFFLLLSGSCQILRSGECLALLRGPVTIGHKQFLLNRAMAGDAVLDDKPEASPVVIRIDGAAFRQLLQKDPDFRRSVYRGNPEMAPAPAPAPAHQILVLDSQEPFALRQLGDRLAERLAVHLQEHVLVLRVTKRGEDQRGAPTVRRPEGTVNGWVGELTRRLPDANGHQGSSLLPRPESFAWLRVGGRFAGNTNVTLVDVSELDAPERGEVLATLARELEPWPDEPIKLVYLSSAPDGFPRTLTLPDRVQFIPTGVLSPVVPVGFGKSLPEVLDERPLQERLKGAGQVLTSARDMLTAMRNHVEGLIQPNEQRPTWPMGTVRVRFPASWLEGEGPRSALKDSEPELCETFDRWARSLTGRRVGLALGGGGAFGYVHLALLRRMLGGEPSQRIPVDMVSGSSFGTVVGAFYTAAGVRGLDLMQKYWPLVAAAFPLAIVSSVGVQWWLDAILGPVKLDQLEVPLFPVVVDSDAGVEWDVRQGTVGYGIRASGSFPPVMGPTLLGNRRLLDGGFVANVPVNVLRAEGADLLVASNPIPRLRPRTRKFSRFPLMRTLWNQVDPLLRVDDSWRMLTLIGRVAGESQSARAEHTVVYSPKYNSATMFGLGRAQEIVEEAKDSLELGQALLEARALWRSRLNNPVSIVPWDGQSTRIELTEPVLFLESGIEPVSLRTVVAELVDFLHQRKEIGGFTIVATAETLDEAEARARVLRQHLIDSCVPQVPEKLLAAGRTLDDGLGTASLVSLEDVGSSGAEAQYAAWLENAWRERKDVARKALLDAQVRRLQLEAERLRGMGDPDLSRLLALETARLDRSGETDRLLRAVLEHRGVQARRFDSASAPTALAWHPEGQRLAVGFKDGSLLLWDVEKDKRIAKLSAHPGGADPQLSWLAWSPSGRLLASSGSDWAMALWEHTDEGLDSRGVTPVGTWDHWGLAFSPDGEYLLTPIKTDPPDEPRSAAVRQVGQEPEASLGEPFEGVGHVRAAAWAPERKGRRFAIVGHDQVTVWKVGAKGLESLQVLHFPGASVLAWSPDAHALLVGGSSGACLFWPGSGSEPLPLDTRGLGVGQVAWVCDGSRFMASLPDRGELYVWDTTGKLLTVLRVEEGAQLREVRCNPKRPELVLTWGGEAGCVWDVSTSRQLAWLGGYTGAIRAAAWSSDGTRVATASLDGSVRVWAPAAGGPERSSWEEFVTRRPESQGPENLRWPEAGATLPLPSREHLIWSVFHPELQVAAVPVRDSRSGRYQLRPWRPGEPLPTAWSEGWFDTVYLSWSPDGTRVALRQEGSVSVWDTKSWKLLAELQSGPAFYGELKPTRVAWHPFEKRLAIGRFIAGGSAVLLWNPEQPDEPSVLSGVETDGVWELAWNPRGDVLAVASNDSLVRLYSVGAEGPTDGTPVLELRHWYPPTRLAWSPTGELLATGDTSGGVSLWNTEGDDLIASGQHRRQPIEHLAWSPDGSRLFSADDGGRGLVWRSAGQEWVTSAVLDSEPERLLWAVFSEDGRWLTAMARDGKVRLHPVAFDELVARVKALPGRNELTIRERSRYLATPVAEPFVDQESA